MNTSENRFLMRLKEQRVILMDGAMGTMLNQLGNYEGRCLDELNVTDPAVVAQVHRSYIDAGAELILSNTFGANRYKLAHYHLQERVSELNRAGVELAKKVASASFKDLLIAGDVGPIGVQLYPYGRLRPSDAYEAFTEQIEALIGAGVDLLMLETHTNLKELLKAVQAAKDIAPEIPVIASMTYLRDDRSAMGDDPVEVAEALRDAGVDVIGANCSGGPSQLLRVLSKMKTVVPEARYSIKPNAGWPERSAGRIFYPDSTDYFANYAVSYMQMGASVVGGCCGTTAEHIAAMRHAIEHLPNDEILIEMPAEMREVMPEEEDQIGPTLLSRKLANGEFVVTVEISPPHGHSLHRVRAAANFFKECGFDAINVADSPMARMRMSPWAICNLLQNNIGIETILHFPTRGRNLLRVQGDLLASHATNIRNVFVMMGDPTSVGDYPDAMDAYDLVPSGLIELLSKQLNRGVDAAGKKISEPTAFFVGGALNLNPPNLKRELRVLRRKVEAGVNFLLTQPVYDIEPVKRFLDAYEAEYGKLEVPILAGLMLIRDAQHASFMHHEIPGITIPDAVMERVLAAEDDARQAGEDIAIELACKLKPLVQGIYIMPFRRYESAAQILDAIRAG
ncbi:MAG: bifunctional homocysteine S-methyltransferase/methylenetetrahydrofolate reductase [Anaerolineaceae bacterium]|nr:bifunctional homocysteine S-methyltransferase/methylenetetrahydrofolate reductase [Anaerolineaceae bacterium]